MLSRQLGMCSNHCTATRQWLQYGGGSKLGTQDWLPWEWTHGPTWLPTSSIPHIIWAVPLESPANSRRLFVHQVETTTKPTTSKNLRNRMGGSLSCWPKAHAEVREVRLRRGAHPPGRSRAGLLRGLLRPRAEPMAIPCGRTSHWPPLFTRGFQGFDQIGGPFWVQVDPSVFTRQIAASASLGVLGSQNLAV